MIQVRQATTENDFNAVRALAYAFTDWLKALHPDAQGAVDQYFESLEVELASLPGKYGPPAGRLLLAHSNRVVAGTVALHDIGNHISYKGHHRHSYYLIKNGDLRGFEPAEIEIVALLARYHRRATPKDEDDLMKDLGKGSRKTVEVLSAFLRLAETLDRSRHGVVKGLEVRERLGQLRIKVQAVGDAELELWAAHRQAEALEEALDRKIRMEKVPYRKRAGLRAPGSGIRAPGSAPRARKALTPN